MLSRTISRLVFPIALALGASTLAQSGLRVPERAEPGLDPAFARGWLAPDFDRFGFARYHWKEAMGFAPSQRMNWSYSFGERGSLGVSLGDRDYEYDQRHFSLFGRYWFGADWALSAEATSRESTGLLRLNDWRIGVQRRF